MIFNSTTLPSQNNTFCYDLLIAVGNKTFCGLTQKWSPRFNQGILLAMAITPVLIYWLILFLLIRKLFEVLHETWRIQTYVVEFDWRFGDLHSDEIRKYVKRFEKVDNNTYKFQLVNLQLSYEFGIVFRIKSYISIIVLVLVKYFWDAIDLTLDVYIFYQLEKGEVLDNAIYRNIHVNNAIYAFAILGCIIKIIAWKFYVYSFQKENSQK